MGLLSLSFHFVKASFPLFSGRELRCNIIRDYIVQFVLGNAQRFLNSIKGPFHLSCIFYFANQKPYRGIVFILLEQLIDRCNVEVKSPAYSG